MDYIPPEQMPQDVEAMKADSLTLVDKYPKDPRAHMFRGLYLLEQNHVADAEPYFREPRGWAQTSPVMTREFQDWNLALLALTLRVQRRDDEARRHRRAALRQSGGAGPAHPADLAATSRKALHARGSKPARAVRHCPDSGPGSGRWARCPARRRRYSRCCGRR